MAHSLPSYPIFECHGDNVSLRWTKWINRLSDNIFVGYGIDDPKRQKALMLSYGGEELNDIFDAIDAAKLVPREDHDDDTVFSRAVDALTEHFNPKQNEEYQRYLFRRCRQEKGENIDQFYARLRQLAATCNFQENSREIKSQLIAGSSIEKLTRKGCLNQMSRWTNS